jgi:glycosyltransferase involved in cell wall biosynthesis
MRILPEERNGFAAALNTGIHVASAERVGFLLSDDWLDSRAVEQCVGHEADIVSTGLRGVADDGVQILDQLGRTPSLDEFRSLPSLERQASYLQHFLLFKKRALREVGGVDEQVGLTGPDDFDMIWTLLERGASVAIVAEQLYNYRDHSGERLSLRSVEAQVGDLRKILDKHGVHGAERAKIIAWHSAAYGLPCHLSVDRRAGLEPPGGQCPSLSFEPSFGP